MNSEETSQKKKKMIIYLSGAGLMPAIWNDVRAKVTTPGVALTYDRSATTTLESATQDILTQIQRLDADQYVIVAHSLSGVVGVELAHALGDKLGGLIAVSATIPAPGKAFVSALPFPQSIMMQLLLRIVGTKPPASVIRKSLCSDLSERQAADIIDAFTPEPRSLYTDKTSTDKLPDSKYLYVRTINDREVSAQLQTSMAKRLPSAKIIDIPSGHMAMISHPDELATIISKFVESQ